MPAKPRWLLAIPDAVAQLEALDRELLTRRDLESLFGVSKARAATLMIAFGAERTGNARTLGRAQLLRRLKARRTTTAVDGELDRRERVATVLRQARISGIRVKVAAEVLNTRLAGLPPGVTVGPGRIEVQCASAKDAVGRLFALAQAITNDYERFEAVVGGGGESG